MARLIILRQATEDYENALEWYQVHSPRTKQRFTREVISALKQISEMPELYACTMGKDRLCRVGKFQQTIVYRYIKSANEVIVKAIPHGKQNYFH